MLIDQLVRSRRKTIAIMIQPDGSLVVRAPLRASLKHIQALVEEKGEWIRRKQEEVRRRVQAQPAHRFVDGECFLYLGQEYPLVVVDGARTPLRLDGNFYLAKIAQPQAAQVFEAWYRAQARQVIGARTVALAQQHGLAFSRLRIMTAHTRWGSCGAGGTLNFNWRLVMAPQPVIDYVILHELAHLKVHNHSPLFWAEVACMLPGYKPLRAWLKAHGQKLTTP
jgi:predicted metal-dependent hydrolase